MGITTNINTNHQTFSLRTSASYISHLSILFTTCIRFRVLPLLTNLPTTTRTSVWTLYPEGPGHFFPIPVFTTTVSGSAFLDPCFEPVVVFFGLNDCSFSWSKYLVLLGSPNNAIDATTISSTHDLSCARGQIGVRTSRTIGTCFCPWNRCLWSRIPGRRHPDPCPICGQGPAKGRIGFQTTTLSTTRDRAAPPSQPTPQCCVSGPHSGQPGLHFRRD